MLASQQQRQGDGGKRRYTYEDVLGSTKKWKPLVSCGASSDASASVSRYVAATVATPPAGENAQHRGNGVEDVVAQAYELCLAKPKTGTVPETSPAPATTNKANGEAAAKAREPKRSSRPGRGGWTKRDDKSLAFAQVKSVVFTSVSPNSDVLDWVRHMAESPHSILFDSQNIDHDVREAKLWLHRLRKQRQEDLLQRRSGLRPASLHSLNLIPTAQYAYQVDGKKKEETYPRKISRVDKAYQAVLPDLRPRPTLGNKVPSERPKTPPPPSHFPTRVWPIKEVSEVSGRGGETAAAMAASGSGRRRESPAEAGIENEGQADREAKDLDIVSLLTDPVDYKGWSEVEFVAFRKALNKWGKDFELISKYVRQTVEASKKSVKDCCAFYYQVFVVRISQDLNR